MLPDPPRAAACNTWAGNEFSAAVALWTCLLDREKPLLHSDLTMAIASRACDGRRPRLGATAVAGFANVHRRDANFCFGSTGCLFERNLEVVTQIGAAIDIGVSASAAEEIAEYVAERVGKTLSTCSTHAGIDACMAMLVVCGALPWV